MATRTRAGRLGLAIALAGCGRIGFDISAGHGDASTAADVAADAGACYTIDEHFDGSALGSQWTPFSTGGGAVPSVAAGALQLDVPTGLSVSSISQGDLDLRQMIATVTVRGFTFVAGTQVYIELSQSDDGIAQLALDPARMRARIESPAGYDDLDATVTPPPAFRLQVETMPGGSGTDVAWRYALSETDAFVPLRAATIAFPLDAAALGIDYQVYGGTAPTDPPPVQIDDLTVEVPCP